MRKYFQPHSLLQMRTFISASTRGGRVGLVGNVRILRHQQQQELDRSDVGNCVSWFAPFSRLRASVDVCSIANAQCAKIAVCRWSSDSRRLTFSVRSPEWPPVTTEIYHMQFAYEWSSLRSFYLTNRCSTSEAPLHFRLMPTMEVCKWLNACYFRTHWMRNWKVVTLNRSGWKPSSEI